MFYFYSLYDVKGYGQSRWLRNYVFDQKLLFNIVLASIVKMSVGTVSGHYLLPKVLSQCTDK